MSDTVTYKTPKEIKIMKEGGARLARVKKQLLEAVEIGKSADDIEVLANKLIKDEGGEASFKLVPRYKWATCINVNKGVVHGIPHKEIVFKDGDLVSVDVGMLYKGFHTDTSFTKLLGNDSEKAKFLEKGKKSLKNAIKAVKPGRKVVDISRAMEDSLREDGLNPVTSLTGHGIGRSLHEKPLVPCFVSGSPDEQVELKVGMVLAIEVMYTDGTGSLDLASDGWTLSTKDGKLSSLFEETVAVTADGRIILTV